MFFFVFAMLFVSAKFFKRQTEGKKAQLSKILASASLIFGKKTSTPVYKARIV